MQCTFQRGHQCTCAALLQQICPRDLPWPATLRHDAGEKRLHATIPLGIAALSLGAMALWIDEFPMLAFLAMLSATCFWGPSGIISSLPASFLKVGTVYVYCFGPPKPF